MNDEAEFEAWYFSGVTLKIRIIMTDTFYVLQSSKCTYKTPNVHVKVLLTLN